MNSFHIIDAETTRDLRPDVLDSDGRMRILPSEFWKETTPAERALVGHSTGYYSFPTTELVDHLKSLIGDRKAIEIGAGNGVLAEALGIVATDSFLQRDPLVRAIYRKAGQPTVPYGTNVVEIAANRAVRKYKPEVVIACWVTHRYLPARHKAGGNVAGVNEEEIIKNCDQYVFIGNEHVHQGKSIWKVQHDIIYPAWLYSRAANGTPDFIATWGRKVG